MKKIYVLLLSLVGFFPVIGQRLMPRASITMPWISYGRNTEITTKVGFSVGFGWEIPVKNFFFQPEIAFTQKGCDFTYDSDENKHKLTTYYGQVVLPAKYFITKGHTKLYAMAGIAVGIGLFGYYQNDDESFSVEFKPYPDGGNDYQYFGYIDHPIDIGAQLGIGVEVWKIFLDLRYEHGLTNLYTSRHRGDFDNSVIENAKNRMIQFSIGVPLNRKKITKL